MSEFWWQHSGLEWKQWSNYSLRRVLELLFSLSVVSDSSWPHGLQHARFPCPSLSPGVCSNSCPLSLCCHPTISSSVASFSCPQSFPASECFPLSRLLAAGGQSIGASASVLPLNIQDWFPLGKTVLISLLSKGLSRVFSSTTIWKHQFFRTQLSLWSNSHIHTWVLEKKIVLTRWTFLGKGWSLLFNMLSRLVITFLPRNKRLLISWLQSPSAVILEPPNIKSDSFHCFPTYLPWSDGTGCHDLHYLNVELQANFFTLLFHPHQETHPSTYLF